MPGRSWLLPLRPRRASDPAAAPAASGIFRGPARLPVATRGSRALGGAAKGGCPAPNSEPTRGPGRPGTRSREWKERVRHAGHGGRAEGLRRARRGLCLAFRGPHSRLPVWLGFGSRGGEQGQGRSPGGKGTPTLHPPPGSPGQPAKFRTEEVVATWHQEGLPRGDIPQGTTQSTWPRRS